jgi:hypothetical protein
VLKFADGGTGPAYNVQVSTDAAHSLIVGRDVTHAGSDYQHLTPAVDRLERTTGDVPDQMAVDGGYISSENILKMAERGIDLIGPESEAKTLEANRQKSIARVRVGPLLSGLSSADFYIPNAIAVTRAWPSRGSGFTTNSVRSRLSSGTRKTTAQSHQLPPGSSMYISFTKKALDALVRLPSESSIESWLLRKLSINSTRPSPSCLVFQ